MAKWKVINVHPNQLTHREMFKGDLIEIKFGEHVLMDYEDAVQFKSQYFPMKIDAMDQPDPAGFKCLKLEGEHEAESPVVKENIIYVCHIDGKKFQTLEALEAHVNSNYSDRIVKDPELDKEIEKQKNKGR